MELVNVGTDVVIPTFQNVKPIKANAKLYFFKEKVDVVPLRNVISVTAAKAKAVTGPPPKAPSQITGEGAVVPSAKAGGAKRAVVPQPPAAKRARS